MALRLLKFGQGRSWQALGAQRPSWRPQKYQNVFIKVPKKFQNVLKLREGVQDASCGRTMQMCAFYFFVRPILRAISSCLGVCEPGNLKWSKASLKNAFSWPKVASSWAQAGSSLDQVGHKLALSWLKVQGCSWQASGAERLSWRPQKCQNGFFKAPKTS